MRPHAIIFAAGFTLLLAAAYYAGQLGQMNRMVVDAHRFAMEARP